MAELNGWHLPGKDSYFSRFVVGAPPKKNGFQREHLLKAFEYVRGWKVAVDVGAHVGFWTADMAERFEQVFAFEPAGDTFACLQKNMAQFSNVRMVPAAIGDKNMLCIVYDDDKRVGNTGSRFIRPSDHGDTSMITLDSLDLPGCDLLKIDVEGFELQVLRGAADLIKAHKPVVIMETDKRFARRYGVPFEAAERCLLAHGYEIMAHMRPDKVFVAS